MPEILDSLLAYLKENWPELLWIIAAAGIASYVAGRRSRIRWKNRDFLDRLNLSLTTIDDGVLRIRTIFETDCEEIFLNESASRKVVELARKTTESNPLLPIPQADRWFYLNAVLNEVSERFAVGQLRRDAGLPVERIEYLLCLTCEKAGAVRTQKVRGMLVRKQMLLNLPTEEPQYEGSSHNTRWQTLNQMAEQYTADPSNFIEIEVCL